MVRGHVALLLLWAGLVAVALVTRPLMPIDETRYLAVAWEMHQSGNWLVPHLNGETYSHKPPLLFWLINIGWSVFGVSETWARLVAPLFGLGSLFLTARLAALLWPSADPRLRILAPMILLGSAFWTLFTTLTMFDCIMSFFALLGANGLVMAAKGRRFTGFAVFALSIGLGVLAKGPVILVYVLPVILFAPWWARGLDVRWGQWIAGSLLGLLAGALMALAWALTAAKAGGEAFGNAILWGQTAGRMRDSFAHQRPFWWYVPLLPILLLPWIFWPATWRAFAWKRLVTADSGSRLCMVIMASGFIVFSLISGKQPHYLLPLFPAFALFLANQLCANGDLIRAPDRWVPGLAVMTIGLSLSALPVIAAFHPAMLERLELPEWATAAALQIGLGLLLASGISLWLGRSRTLVTNASALMVLPLALVVLLHIFGMGQARPAYDLKPIASAIRAAQDEGRPIANASDYHGEFHFTGRLKSPLKEISFAEIEGWLKQNPNGRVVARYVTIPASGLKPIFVQPLRGRTVVLWGAVD